MKVTFTFSFCFAVFSKAKYPFTKSKKLTSVLVPASLTRLGQTRTTTGVKNQNESI